MLQLCGGEKGHKSAYMAKVEEREEGGRRNWMAEQEEGEGINCTRGKGRERDDKFMDLRGEGPKLDGMKRNNWGRMK